MQGNTMPAFVNVINDDRSISQIRYRDLKQHEEGIIEDNIAYGITHAEYSDQEICEYERNARAEWRTLKDLLRKHPDTKLRLDKTTQRYVPALTVVKI